MNRKNSPICMLTDDDKCHVHPCEMVRRVCSERPGPHAHFVTFVGSYIMDSWRVKQRHVPRASGSTAAAL